MPMSDVAAESVSVSLSARRVLSDVNLVIGSGEFVIILGRNGSGKTTLVRTLLGLVSPDAGTVSLLGTRVDRFHAWHKVGYVPQRLALPTAMPATVHEVVMSGRLAHAGLWRRYSNEDRAAARRALDIVDLGDLESERVSLLSGGQQQLVLIARALATEPQILVLDEPVASVDVEHQGRFAQLLHDANEDGVTVLLVAHALGAMSGLASRAIVLDAGTVVFDGPPGDTPAHVDEVHHHGPDEGRGLRSIGDEG
jgi:zinc transport system ATP-binding protein